MSGPALISERAIRVIRRHQDALFDAGLALADPNVSVTFTRYNHTTHQRDTLAAQTVMVRYQGDRGVRGYGEGGQSTPLASSPTAVDGMLIGRTPFNVEPADRFELSGRPARIVTVYPARNGRVRATFVLESDGRTLA